MHIEYLFYEDCPSHEEGLERLRKVLADEGITAEIERIQVRTEEEAQLLRFIGSPTIRVDGEDIDPEAEGQTFYALTCRAYRHENGRISPLPSEETIRRAVRRKRP